MELWPAALRRHRDVFGSEPDGMAHEHLRRLVELAIRESDDLDFKRDHYGRTDKAKIGLATDISSLANDRGGVIVVGVEEDDEEVASKLTPVLLDGEHQRWIREIVARHTAPHVAFEIVTVSSIEDTAHGWLLLVVPPSPLRPHAVVNGDNLRYSRRHGTTTRHLGEAEVADLYRNRFAAARTDVERVDEIMREGLAGLDRRDGATLAISLFPAAPGRMDIDGPQLARVSDWINGKNLHGIGRARFWLG